MSSRFEGREAIPAGHSEMRPVRAVQTSNGEAQQVREPACVLMPGRGFRKDR